MKSVNFNSKHIGIGDKHGLRFNIALLLIPLVSSNIAFTTSYRLCYVATFKIC